jgi:phage shock protein PspC (stress-responsive transcriptional regulator)
MNKTVTINISGIIFHIEEDAYERLNRYLATIRSYFSSSDGRDEIMADIESRIAELLQEKISPSKQVVTMADVDHVVGIMGKPEEFAGEDAHANSGGNNAGEEYQGERLRRRLFRDPDHKVLGGVCSGIANYFGMDVVWIRIILVALTFLGFSGVLVYIILWIAVPEARTTTEKLQMRGETVDINNISKTVKEEAEHIKNRAKDFGQNMRSRGKATGGRANDAVYDFFSALGAVLVRVIGFIMVCFSTGILFAIAAGVLGFNAAGNTETLSEKMEGVFDKPGMVGLTWFSLFLAIGVPLIMLMYKGIKMLFAIKYHNKWINISAGILWVTGIALCTYVGLKTGASFDSYSEAKDHRFIAQPKQDTLYVSLNMNNKYNSPGFLVDNSEKTNRISINGSEIIREGDKKIFFGDVKVHIIHNHADTMEVLVVNSSNGPDTYEAKRLASLINYEYTVKDSAILLNSYFTVGVKEKWRNQSVDVYIKLPKGKVVYLDPTVKEVLFDVDNTTKTRDDKMVGRRWKMTQVELSCIDCDGLETFEDRLERKMKRQERELEEQLERELEKHHIK